MCCGSGFGRSTRPRQTRCSTICSARLPISMRSRRVSFAIPAKFRSLSRRSPGSSSARVAGGAEASWETLEIPPTVQGVIASRIDRLSKEDKALLQLASVLGPRISPHLLAAVTEMPAAQLQSRLWSLEILDFLEEARSVPSVEYVFAHDLIREVAYESILRSQREVLHRRILTALEAISTGREEDVAEALCHHAVKAQDWSKADRYGAFGCEEGVCQIRVPGRHGIFQDRHGCGGQAAGIDGARAAGDRSAHRSAAGVCVVWKHRGMVWSWSRRRSAVQDRLATREGGLPPSRSGRRR